MISIIVCLNLLGALRIFSSQAGVYCKHVIIVLMILWKLFLYQTWVSIYLAYFWICRFLHIWIAFSNVLDLREPAFRKKCCKEYKAKCMKFTVFHWINLIHTFSEIYHETRMSEHWYGEYCEYVLSEFIVPNHWVFFNVFYPVFLKSIFWCLEVGLVELEIKRCRCIILLMNYLFHIAGRRWGSRAKIFRSEFPGGRLHEKGR